MAGNVNPDVIRTDFPFGITSRDLIPGLIAPTAIGLLDQHVSRPVIGNSKLLMKGGPGVLGRQLYFARVACCYDRQVYAWSK
jgi:hypothetical protein